MLSELRIRNLAIIDDLTVRFGKGLNILTGETGAGKSIIIDSLGLALGSRAQSEFVRAGEKEAVVQAIQEMVAAISAQADPQGHYTATSMYKSWQGWSFADKKNPSPWITFLALRILKRAEG